MIFSLFLVDHERKVFFGGRTSQSGCTLIEDVFTGVIRASDFLELANVVFLSPPGSRRWHASHSISIYKEGEEIVEIQDETWFVSLPPQTAYCA